MHGRRPNAEALAMVRRDPRMRRRRRVRSPWSAARSGEKFARRIRGDLSRLLDVVLLEGLGCAVDGVLLHVLAHVRILDHGLALRHLSFTQLISARSFLSSRLLAPVVSRSAENVGPLVLSVQVGHNEGLGAAAAA